MRNKNLFIFERGTRWQRRAHTSRDFYHRDERWVACHKGNQSQWETSDMRRQERAHTSKNLHHRDMMKFRRGTLQGSIRTSGYVEYGNKILVSGNITSRNSRQWQGEVLKICCQVRSRDDTELMAQSSRVIYPTVLKERHCQNFLTPWEAEQWVHMRVELVVWETSGGYCC